MDDKKREEILRLGPSSIDSATIEFKSTFQERTPYISIQTLTGPCFKWEEEFIANILIAMSTDAMIQFTEEEVRSWNFFVNFQNYHTTSALDTSGNGLAIGCTIPDAFNKSFVVIESGVILNGLNGQALELCQPPGYEIEGELVWRSLDNVLMSLLNCTTPDDCNRSLDIEYLYKCI